MKKGIAIASGCMAAVFACAGVVIFAAGKYGCSATVHWGSDRG